MSSSEAAFGDPGAPQWARRQAFAVQYTSLMLIIVCFVVGGLFGNSVQQLREQSEKPAAPPKAADVGMIAYTDLFAVDSAFHDETIFSALTQVLTSHDVNARLILFRPRGMKALEGLKIALERSNSVLRDLVQAGVPRDAITAQVMDQESEVQIQIEWLPEGSKP